MMKYFLGTFLIALASSVSGGVESSVPEVDVPPLLHDFYKESCPHAEGIVRRHVEFALLKDPRAAASLLRLHFHDCFVMGCDASVLLDNSAGIVSEKQAGPNLNSLRGFEIIDEIKESLEISCPCTVSCADILAIVARDAVHLRGGPGWEVLLGRRDSLEASFSGANQFIPSPNSSLETLIANFDQQGLDIQDLVALSGSHTIGRARCTNFRQRVYDANYLRERHDHYKRHNTFRRSLRSICPRNGSGGNFAPLDYVTPTQFDSSYFVNVLEGNALLGSDNVLVNEDLHGDIIHQVWSYAYDEDLFFASFAKSMVKMGNIDVLTGHEGEIRRNCRFVNV